MQVWRRWIRGHGAIDEINILKMPRKCSIFNCNGGYASDSRKRKIYAFPTDPDVRESWIKSIPNKFQKVTQNMGVCEDHWPATVSKKRKFGHLIPELPPSIFSGVPSSCSIQSKPCSSRCVEKRKILFKDRTNQPDESALYMEMDKLPSFDILREEIGSKSFLKYYDLTVIQKEDEIVLIKVDNTYEVEYSLVIHNSMKCVLRKLGVVICPGYCLGFHKIINRWSTIERLIEHILAYNLGHKEKIRSLLSKLHEIGLGNMDEDILFFASQISISLCKPTARRYNSQIIKKCLPIFLSGRRNYERLRKVLYMPSSTLLNSYFGEFGAVHTSTHSSITIEEILSNFETPVKYANLIFDEIYVLPSVRYRGGHLIGKSADDPQKIARTVLAIMVKPFFGEESFVARLLPIYNLSKSFCLSQLLNIINQLHVNGVEIISLLSDNHPTNRMVFKELHSNLPEEENLIADEYFEGIGCDSKNKSCQFFTMFDPVHLIKSIRNNWLTEKDQKLELVIPSSEKRVCAKWSDLVHIYEAEKENNVRSTNLSARSLFPSAIERQKVSLVLNIFNYKTSAALRLKGYSDTADFIDVFTRFWDIMNIKSPFAGNNLNDNNRKPFYSPYDERLRFLEELIESLKAMKAGKGKSRCKGFSYETRKALCHTISSMINIIKYLLSKEDFKYVLPGDFQSDNLEGEFGVYRQLSGGNYYISVEQVIYSAKFRNLRLFRDLDSIRSAVNNENPHLLVCCNSEFTQQELDVMDQALSYDDYYDEFSAPLYYIAGYVANKQNISSEDDLDDNQSSEECEFFNLVNRGNLSIPPSWLIFFTIMCYSVFDQLSPKCFFRLVKQFSYLSEYVLLLDEDLSSINFNAISKQLANTFFAGLVRRVADEQRPQTTLSLTERQKNKLQLSRMSRM